MIPTPDSVWRHNKSQANYIVIGLGLFQWSQYPALDNEEIVLYERIGEDTTYARPLTEFMDGRFTFIKQTDGGLYEQSLNSTKYTACKQRDTSEENL